MISCVRRPCTGKHVSTEEVILWIHFINTSFHAGILLSLFSPKNGGSMFLQNVSWLSVDCMVLCPTRRYSSCSYEVINPGMTTRLIFIAWITDLTSNVKLPLNASSTSIPCLLNTRDLVFQATCNQSISSFSHPSHRHLHLQHNFSIRYHVWW
jgi:hypothetical protein